MVEALRKKFNQDFSLEKYHQFLKEIALDFNYAPTFRIAETPFFIPDYLKNEIKSASEEVIEFIARSDFKKLTQRSIDLTTNVPGEDAHTQFLAIDFGICEQAGKIIPKLIEVQGFPTIFNFQYHLFKKFSDSYPFLSELTTPYFDGIDEAGYLEILKKVILKNHQPDEVVLLEIEPEKQNTRIDFLYCQKDLGIPVICVTEVIKKKKKIFYRNEIGELKQIKRIYNRVIFDELNLRKDLKYEFSFEEELEVEWAGHPNWYTRISKFILPFLKGKYFIDTILLSEMESIPQDLENYVLKPLFSFSGTGVIFHVTLADIEAVKEKELYILQKKVFYAPVIQSLEGKVKAEVRVLALWPEEDERPTLVGNLVRLSRGEMIGVKFNKDKNWVGGTIGLFEK
jgi:hypothetical protein